jgi:disulfide bond formation protein DsbB
MKKVSYLTTALLLFLTLSLAACGGDSSSQSSGSSSQSEAAAAPKGDAAAGKEKFATVCVACHGPEGEGVPGLGKDMTSSEFIAGKTDEELVEFIKVGRDPSDPLNTTGVAMPPKGGNPAFTDEDLYNIVAHIRTLQK